MSVINQDDFLGRIDHVLGDSGKKDPSLEEQRQMENFQQLEMEHLLTPMQEFDGINHKEFIKKMKFIALNRNRSNTPRDRSKHQWKKSVKRSIVLGEVTDFLFTHIVGTRSESSAPLHDELHAFSTRFYVKDPTLFMYEIPLTNKPGSPTVRFVKREWVDRIGNTLPYQDWALRVIDGRKVTFFEPPYTLDELVNEYLSMLALAAEEGGWVVK